MKKLLLLVLLSFPLLMHAAPLPIKPCSVVTYTSLSCSNTGPNSYFNFIVGVDQPNTVDYRVVVGVYEYFQGFYKVGTRTAFGYHWGYVYYSCILSAGEQYFTLPDHTWTYNSDNVTVDPFNYYVSYYAPN